MEHRLILGFEWEKIVKHLHFFPQVPATREVLGSLPNVFSALCLNARGLHSFVQCQPFERLFKVLLSPDYLPAMRRRRSSDPLGEFPILFFVLPRSSPGKHISLDDMFFVSFQVTLHPTWAVLWMSS